MMSSSCSSPDWVLGAFHCALPRFICVYLCVFCAFVFHTAYMLCYCQHSGVDLVGLKPGP